VPSPSRFAPRSLRALTMALLAPTVSLALLLLGSPASATPSEQELDAQIQTKSQQFNKAVEQYDRVKSDLDASKKKSAALAKKIKPLQEKVAAEQKRVGSIASAAYRGGDASALNAILTNGSPETLLDSLSMLNQIARGQAAQISSLIKAKAELDKQKQQLDATVAKQTKQEKDLKSKQTSLNKDINKLKAMREQAYGSPTEYAARGNYGPPPAVAGTAGKAVSYAWNALGAPYQYGAAGPNSYDCSGLTMAAWQAAGISLPHNAAAQYSDTTRISRGDLQPGDLVFYYNNDHVAIYIGNGTVIHAPTYGEPVQRAPVDSMPADGYGRVG
jgi:peptidoglycan DL-endopeptidase CwlO